MSISNDNDIGASIALEVQSVLKKSRAARYDMVTYFCGLILQELTLIKIERLEKKEDGAA